MPEKNSLQQHLWAALGAVLDPDLRRPITELGMAPVCEVDFAGVATVELRLTTAACPAAASLETAVREAAAAVPGVTELRLKVTAMTPAQRATFFNAGRNGERATQFNPACGTRVIAVTSGKGGVGKSSITANLATALAVKGLRVGLVDADVFGFSIPGIMGLVSENGQISPPARLDGMIVPPVAHGVATVSVGMFLGEQDTRTTAVSWRGPMLHRTLAQFLSDVHFGPLNFLLLDLPPGTGDIAISAGQLLPHAEVLVVTTPQPAAADVAVRSGLVAHQTGQKVLGVVENMSAFTAPDGSVIELFGAGGGEIAAERLSGALGYDVPLLGTVPLSAEFRAAGDIGHPAVLASPACPASGALLKIADFLASENPKQAAQN
ncbi:MAG: P-loop NTPase [Microbacteriaceae bacterium]|nr:P-loop NTPase [Microbacteriaceae bacterium]